MSRSLRIAIADDEADMRYFFQEVLPALGHEVVVAAESGVQLVEQCRLHRPDLIITDIKMPAADGVHLVRRVRDTAGISETPILVTTGFGSGSATFALGQGATAYEPKPINPESFMATVKRLVEQEG